MISGKQAILRQELRGGARLVDARRKYNAKVQRLEGGRASPMEVLDALFDDLPHLMPLSGGGKPSKKTIHAARKDSKWLIRLIYDMMVNTFVCLQKTGETIALTKIMEEKAKAMGSNLRGGAGCKGRRKTKDPTCESDDRCEWVKYMGCREKETAGVKSTPQPKERQEREATEPTIPKDPPVTLEHAEKAIASKKALDEHWFTRYIMNLTPQQRERHRQLLDAVDDDEFEARIRNKGILSRTYARVKRILSKVLKKAWELKSLLVLVALGTVMIYCAYRDGDWARHPLHYNSWKKRYEDASWEGKFKEWFGNFKNYFTDFFYHRGSGPNKAHHPGRFGSHGGKLGGGKWKPFSLSDEDFRFWFGTDAFFGRKPENGFSKPGFDFGKPENGFSKPGFDFGKPEYGFSKPGFDFGKPENGFSKPGFDFDKPENGFSKPGFDFGKPENGFGTPENGFSKPGFDFGNNTKPEFGNNTKPEFGNDTCNGYYNYSGFCNATNGDSQYSAAFTKMGNYIMGAVCVFVRDYLRGTWNKYCQKTDSTINFIAEEHAFFGAFAGIGTGASLGFNFASFTGLGWPVMCIVGSVLGGAGGYMTEYQKGTFIGLSIVAGMHLTLVTHVFSAYFRVFKPSKDTKEVLEATQTVIENYLRAYSHISTSVASMKGMPLRVAANYTGHGGILEANDRFVQGLVKPFVPTQWAEGQAQTTNVFRTMEKDLHLLADEETKKFAKRFETYYNKKNNAEEAQPDKIAVEEVQPNKDVPSAQPS